MFVVSKPGDEIALSFDASAVPPLRPGWRRTFLLYRRRLQQGDGHPLGEPGRRSGRCRSTACRVPLRAGRALSGRRRRTATYQARWNTRVVSRVVPTIDAARASAAADRKPMTHLRYSAAACQTDLSNPLDRSADGGEHRSHAGDDRRRGGRRRAVPAGPARRVSGVRARRAGLSRPSRSCASGSPCRSRTSTPTACERRRASTASTSRAGR